MMGRTIRPGITQSEATENPVARARGGIASDKATSMPGPRIASDAEITQVIDRLHRRQVTVLDKQPVCGDETYVVGGWMPVQLALERDFRFDVALHRCY